MHRFIVILSVNDIGKCRALFQLAFIRGLEDSYGDDFPTTKLHRRQSDGYLKLPRGMSHWHGDKEAEICVLDLYNLKAIDGGKEVKPEIISWSPRIIVLHNFLSNEECDYLRAIARPRLQVSTVVDVKTGKGIKSNVRTSSGMFLSPTEKVSNDTGERLTFDTWHEMITKSESNSAPPDWQQVERRTPGYLISLFPKPHMAYMISLLAIEKRISVFSQIPAENGELIQVLRYEKDQFYKPHHDYFSDTFNLKRGGQRIATMLMYLSDDVEGGETYFPMAGTGDCSCGGKTVKGMSVKPIKGDAVLFWSMGLDGQSDPNSIHGGCEVLSGEKWSATKWMRQKPTF
ncbi:hypothetical protein CXB51_026037 [Gossypium anomalum]|uniref:Fe2OG dioxygenase domain-containing protein n=2 Tax=Gossypium TaxID=3633 RepID=A0A8J5Z4R4_9ROSI|nr:hypothetical protein CXB51_026037 [Gossypium anomalum]